MSKQSGRCHFQSGPPQANSLILPEACHDSEIKKRGCWKEFQGACCAHDDTACFRNLTESGIILWRHRLLHTISSKFFSKSCACNLRPETWRRWLSVCLRKHLMLLRALALWLPNQHISSRGTSSAHNAVFLTESDIISLLYMVAYCITNKSRSKVFLRYWLSSPLVARPCT